MEGEEKVARDPTTVPVLRMVLVYVESTGIAKPKHRKLESKSGIANEEVPGVRCIFPP